MRRWMIWSMVTFEEPIYFNLRQSISSWAILSVSACGEAFELHLWLFSSQACFWFDELIWVGAWLLRSGDALWCGPEPILHRPVFVESTCKIGFFLEFPILPLCLVLLDELYRFFKSRLLLSVLLSWSDYWLGLSNSCCHLPSSSSSF